MLKYKAIVFILLAAVLMSGRAYSQDESDKSQKIIISGTVTKVDEVGNIINIKTDQGELAFSVSDSAIIVRNTHDIELMDIKVGHPVTIQYSVYSPGKNIITSIVDNAPGND
ncbi:MAG: hypothetical protein HQL24_09010 [Candidatus Omnitrophica bacterium]|nr:hypothetical protein [Candidatus Omnitrophota bacterium]